MPTTTFKRKILVIEDNEINREILSAILSDNYEVVEALNGKEGLDILEKDPSVFSLIVLDIQMPVMNGFEFLEKYKENAQYRQIPIIVTTSEREEEEKCLVLGASDFVSKPYNSRIMLRRIEALIRLRESTFALQRTKFEPLSELYNKEYFVFYTETLLNKFLNKNYCFILIQIEDIRYLNHNFGEDRVNELIRFVSRTINSYNENVICGRYGGDQFLCFFDKSLVNCGDFIEYLKTKLYENSPLQKAKIKLAIYDEPDHNLKVSHVVYRLVEAVKQISHNFLKNVIFYDEALIKHEETIHFIEENMEESLKNNNYVVCYQPKHEVKTGKLAGAEALVRWVHPKKGFISPADFVPVFEQNGFITKLDLYIIDKACQYLSERIKEKKEIVPISVNLSRRDLAAFENTQVLDNILEKYHVEKKYIHIEITESICGDSNDVVEKTKMLRDAGYLIEIDDFGSGYSSLNLISEIPMDYLKLDLSFIKKVCRNYEFAKTVIHLAHVLNAKTVVEGVETEEEVKICRELGCDYIQGYYYSKPIAADEFSQYCDKEI